MDVLYKTEVTPDQIDHLGHMNVRYYGTNARAGAERLLSALGLDTAIGGPVVQRYTYVRHHHEQLLGSPLEVRGGVLDVSGDRVRIYEELVNSDTDDVAATFVLTFELTEPTTRARTAFDDATVERARLATVELPERGRPRSISLDGDPAASAPGLDVLRERGLALRQVRAVTPAECDAHGNVLPMAIPALVWDGEPAAGREFRPFEPLPGGGQMGFATMETRTTWKRFVREGDRIQSFGAEVDVQAKTFLSRNWVYDADRSDLVGVFSIVSLAFDLDARRSVVIPDAVRKSMGGRLHTDLA